MGVTTSCIVYGRRLRQVGPATASHEYSSRENSLLSGKDSVPQTLVGVVLFIFIIFFIFLVRLKNKCCEKLTPELTRAARVPSPLTGAGQ